MTGRTKTNLIQDRHLSDAGMLLLLAATATIIGIEMHPLMVDDAYITYTHARNLARLGQLAYNPGSPYLSTTAPLYAILLGSGRLLGLPIPALSKALGAAGIFGAALFLYLLCGRRDKRLAGAVAGLLLVTSPLLWLSLGLETGIYLLLVCGAIYYYDRARYTATAVLTAAAVLTRPDSVLLLFILVVHYVFVRQQPLPWRAIGAFAALTAPVLATLTLSFGSPVPVTLNAKRAQAYLGVTGFYEDTSVLRGLLILLRGWEAQSPLYYAWLLLLPFGVLSLRRSQWAWALVSWAILHLLAYWFLDVAPYYWYYAPLIPAGVLLPGLALQWVARRPKRRRAGALLAVALLVCLIAAQAASLHACVSALEGEPPPPTDPQAKVLPEAKGTIYQKTGQWLEAHTEESASVAAIEIGIIGYYADRTMIDFLGLLQPDVARALKRGDLYYTILHYMPDYIVLGEQLYVYGMWLGGDEWFLASYRPIEEISDRRFWGSPLVVLERRSEAAPITTHACDLSFAPDLELKSFGVEQRQLHPGDGLRIRLDWLRHEEMDQTLQIVVYMVDGNDGIVALRDRRSDTSDWPRDKVSPVYYPLLLDDQLTAGDYHIRARVVREDQTDVIHQLTTVSVKTDVESTLSKEPPRDMLTAHRSLGRVATVGSPYTRSAIVKDSSGCLD